MRRAANSGSYNLNVTNTPAKPHTLFRGIRGYLGTPFSSESSISGAPQWVAENQRNATKIIQELQPGECAHVMFALGYHCALVFNHHGRYTVAQAGFNIGGEDLFATAILATQIILNFVANGANLQVLPRHDLLG